jgi:hypothetical protein
MPFTSACGSLFPAWINQTPFGQLKALTARASHHTGGHSCCRVDVSVPNAAVDALAGSADVTAR